MLLICFVGFVVQAMFSLLPIQVGFIATGLEGKITLDFPRAWRRVLQILPLSALFGAS